MVASPLRVAITSQFAYKSQLLNLDVQELLLSASIPGLLLFFFLILIPLGSRNNLCHFSFPALTLGLCLRFR